MRFTALFILVLANAAFAEPTMEEIRREFDAGKYSAAISMTSRALAARGPEAAKIDRYELLYLRGEALLKLKQAKYAEQAFEEAFAATMDAKKKAAAVAMAAVIRRSPGLAYAPRREPGTKIDIVDDTSRKLAMSAIHEDLKAAVTPKVMEAMNAQTLPALTALLPDLFELAALETALTGDNKQSKEYFLVLGKRARELIAAELDSKRRFLEEANGVLYGLEISTSGNIRPRTLGTEDKKQLEDLQDYVARLRAAAIRGRKIAQSLGETGAAWENIIANAGELLDRIERILVQGQ